MTEYAVGTKLRGNYNGAVYTVTSREPYVDLVGLKITDPHSNMEGAEVTIAIDRLRRDWTIISELNPADYEYVVTGESPWGNWLTLKFETEEEAKREARKINAGLADNFTIKVEKVYFAPAAERIDF